MDAADFYSGIVADAYAKLKSASFAAEPYARFVRLAGQPGLEIGCGDGEPLLELCADGLDVDGVDSSLDMVKRCRDHASHLGLDVVIYHQRVEELALERRYRSITLPVPRSTCCRTTKRRAGHYTRSPNICPTTGWH